MKKIITAIILLIATNMYGQDSSKKRHLTPAEIKKYGKWISVTVDGKNTLIRNPNYDPSKFLKRDTSRRFDNVTIAIFYAGTAIPVIKKEFISEMIYESSEHLKNDVITVRLKPGVQTLTIPQLLEKFGISQENKTLPLYIDFRPITNSNEVLAVPQAVYKIEPVIDNDGFKFLNIYTMQWEADRKKYGDNVLWIK